MGLFLTFEGLDGCGKSTQAQILATALRHRGLEVVVTREPGGTPLGERIRELAVGSEVAPSPEAELALMIASRAQSVAEVIGPALARGAWVVCDRFHDATEAYQGGGRGLDRGAIAALHRLLCADLRPDLTFVLEMPVRTALGRAHRRVRAAATAPARFEMLDDAFFERVAGVYREIAAREPARCRLIAATGTVDEVAARVMDALRPGAVEGEGGRNAVL